MMTPLRRTIALMLASAVVASCAGPDDTPLQPVPKYSAAQFFQTTSYQLVPAGAKAFSPDGGSVLLSSDATGIYNAYRLTISGGATEQLTHSTDQAIYAVSFFPTDDRILITFDSAGDELSHVAVRETDGTVRDLTPGDELKAEFVGWRNDGESFYLMTTERNQKTFDVYRYSVHDYSRELVFENPGLQVVAVSGDGRWLALDKIRTSADSDVYIVDLTSIEKQPVLISEHEGTVAVTGYEFTPNSRFLTFSTDEFGEFAQAWNYDLMTGEKTPLLKAAWDILWVSYSPGGRYRLSGVNADARTEVTLFDRAAGREVQFPELPPGDLRNIRFHDDESRLVLIVNADNSPSNIFYIDLDDSTGTQLTEALNPAIDPDHLVRGRVVRYKSFDSLEIPAILYQPRNASPDRPTPALVWVHGGPGGQSRRTYSATIQHLVNHGYAVLAANNRGSFGYGKTFFHLDDRRHGEEDLQDIVYGRRYLESLDWVDRDRVGVIGGSYGGYMVCAALAFEPEVFDVGINIFGVTNWLRTIESVPPWWEDFRGWIYTEMGDPATDSERLRRISPLFHADNIVKPLLVVQGANDPRVLKVESDEIVAAVKSKGVPVEYLVFPDEGHGFEKRSNRIAASDAYVSFLDTHLAGDR